MAERSRRAASALERIREQKVLVHSVTNLVVMNSTANALLALGASPVMAHAHEEVEAMASLAGAVVLNMGTLDEGWVTSMRLAGAAANRRGTPVVFDPVGSGATPYRTATARSLVKDLEIAVVRGNASEILSLSGGGTVTKGVDAVHVVEDAAREAGELALTLETTIAITGAVDLVTDGRTTLRVEGGHQLMRRVTGTGCLATAVVAAFCAVDKEPVAAAVAGLAMLKLAAERAAERAAAPGSFEVALRDALYELGPDDLARFSRIRVVSS